MTPATLITNTRKRHRDSLQPPRQIVEINPTVIHKTGKLSETLTYFLFYFLCISRLKILSLSLTLLHDLVYLGDRTNEGRSPLLKHRHSLSIREIFRVGRASDVPARRFSYLLEFFCARGGMARCEG